MGLNDGYKKTTYNPIVNKYKKALFTHTEIMQIVAMKSKYSVKTVNKVYSNLVDFLVEALKTNGKIRLKGLGTFYAETTEGGERYVPVPTGGRELKYCHPKRKLFFTPSENFLDGLNEDFGVNVLRNEQKKLKRGELIESNTPLKLEKEQLVKSLIQQEAQGKKVEWIDELDDFDEDDLESDIELED